MTDAALSDAYRTVRRNPADADARVALAAALMAVPRHDLARRHLLRAVALAPDAWRGGIAAGEMLFQLGEFVACTEALGRAAPHSARDTSALMTLSAIQARYGDPAVARKLLRHAARRRPVVLPDAIDPEKPTILRIRSADKGELRIVRSRRDGLFRRRLAGQHFSVRNLLEPERFNIAVANLSAGADPDPAGLPRFDIAINAIACADYNPEGLQQAARVLAALPAMPVINDPLRMLRTTRGENARRLGAIAGLTFPRTELIAVDDRPARVAARIEALDLGYPLILRERGTQSGETVRLILDQDALAAYLAEAGPDAAVYAIEHVDTRGAEGFHHMTRAFFIGGHLFPVSAQTSDFWHIRANDRHRVMADHRWMQERERDWLRDPSGWLGAAHVDRLHAVDRLLGLDFYGIDFTVTRAGQLVVFEANPTMRHSFAPAGRFPYLRPHLDAIRTAFQAMVERRARNRPDAS